MKVSEILKCNEKFNNLKEFKITSLEEISQEDGPTWSDRVKRAHIIKDSIKKLINKTQEEHQNKFLDYKDYLLNFTETEMSKILNQTVTIDDDKFIFSNLDIVTSAELNNAFILITDILRTMKE
jgi:hypothetical protein